MLNAVTVYRSTYGRFTKHTELLTRLKQSNLRQLIDSQGICSLINDRSIGWAITDIRYTMESISKSQIINCINDNTDITPRMNIEIITRDGITHSSGSNWGGTLSLVDSLMDIIGPPSDIEARELLSDEQFMEHISADLGDQAASQGTAMNRSGNCAARDEFKTLFMCSINSFSRLRNVDYVSFARFTPGENTPVCHCVNKLLNLQLSDSARKRFIDDLSCKECLISNSEEIYEYTREAAEACGEDNQVSSNSALRELEKLEHNIPF